MSVRDGRRKRYIMINQNQSRIRQNRIAGHIDAACCVLNHTLNTISEMFLCDEIMFIDSRHKGGKDKIVELKFDTVTIECWSNGNNICNKSYLFLDNLGDLQHYIDYCNKEYPYDHQLKGWRTRDYLIRLFTDKKDCFLALLPLK